MILSLKTFQWLILTGRLQGANVDLTLITINIGLIVTLCSIVIHESLILVPIMFNWCKIYDKYKKDKLSNSKNNNN